MDGKRDGKGKEYFNNGQVQFEGEYKKGKKWTGKGYDINGNLDYELKNGTGKIKEYNYFDKLIFEGEYLNNLRHGKGKVYSKTNGQLIFEGEYLTGKKNGFGKEYYLNGQLFYEGEYLEGNKSGKGKKYNNGQVIDEGDFINDMKLNKKMDLSVLIT